MFRLIKLLAYTAIGYFIYQLWQGMRDVESGGGGGQAGGSRGSQSRRNLKRALNEDQGRMQNMTGTGRGTTVSSEDGVSGMTVPHVVGRGVVSR